MKLLDVLRKWIEEFGRTDMQRSGPMDYQEYMTKRELIGTLPQRELIALTIYGECRSRKEPREARIQVGWIAFRREINKVKWDDILDKQQFSYLNFPINENDEKNFNTVTSVRLLDPVFIECLEIANGIVDGTIPEPFERATHYHAEHVQPSWAPKMIFLGKLGTQLFYRDEMHTTIA